MRIVATTICALTLAGCASNLPYSITIGDPSGGKSVVGQEDCVLHLDNIVEKVAEDNLSSKSTIRSLQKQFEKKLSEDTQAMNNCNNGNGKSVIEEVAKKSPEKVLKVPLHPMLGLQAYQARELAYKLGFKDKLAGEATKRYSAP